MSIKDLLLGILWALVLVGSVLTVLSFCYLYPVVSGTICFIGLLVYLGYKIAEKLKEE